MRKILFFASVLTLVPSAVFASEPKSLSRINDSVKHLSFPPAIETRDLGRLDKALSGSHLEFLVPLLTLQRIAGNCDDLAFQEMPFDYLETDMVGQGVGWTHGVWQKTSTLYDEYNELHKQIDADYETYGEELCRMFYNAYGPAGKSGLLFAEFVNKHSPKWKYKGQVLHRNRDLCENTAGFYDAATDKDWIQLACERARKFTKFWGD